VVSRGRGLRVEVGPRRSWSVAGGTHATGFAFRGDTMLDAEQLAAAIDATAPERLPALLASLTGSYAAITERPEATYAIVDGIRGIPLFCVDEDGQRIVTDDPLRVGAPVRATDNDWRRRAELLETAYVTGHETLLDDVRQVEAGSFLRVPTTRGEPVASQEWYAFEPGLDPTSAVNLVETAYDAHQAAVERTIRFAGGALIAVPLSAGLDSGILAGLLARSGIDRDQILTYTYGRPGNRESEVSKRVAESLGLRWEFVAYSESTWQELARQPWWSGYLLWASSLAASPGFSDVPALLDLRRRELIPPGSLVVPGHSLGFPAGSYIPGSLLRRRRGSRADVVDAVLATYYKYRSNQVVGQLLGRPAEEVADAIRERVDRSLPATSPSMSRAQLVAVTDHWGWKERQAKLIVNSVRVYEHLDLRWALPWWDREVVDFWAHVPLRQRVGQRLRHELGQRVGWPSSSRSTFDDLQERVHQHVRVLALDGLAKRLRTIARRSTRRSRYQNDELACFALFGEERYARSFHGTETPRAMLAEDVLAALDHHGGPRSDRAD
jgi:asparagine synthase (glutamine-hydrolysing)